MQEGNTAQANLHTGVLAATANTNAVNVGGFDGVVAYLNATAKAGTSPTLDVKLQDSPDGVTWYDVPSAAFTQLTNTGSQRLVVSNLGSFLRAVQTLGGTASPSFTYTLDVVGVR